MLYLNFPDIDRANYFTYNIGKMINIRIRLNATFLKE